MLGLLLLLAAGPSIRAQTGDNVLLVVNQASILSRPSAEYYQSRRSVPAQNVCVLEAASEEEISWETYEQRIEQPVGACLEKSGLQEKVLYIVLAPGVPLRVRGTEGGRDTEYASVDSELTLLYAKLKGRKFPRPGPIANPFFQKRDAAFVHPAFPIYLVTRLGGWDFPEIKALIDRSLAARNRGKFVIDLKAGDKDIGNNWLRTAAMLLPADRVILDETAAVLERQRDVIGYASYGSNDPARKQRGLGFQWLPGAIVADFVSTNARTLKRPPNDWTYAVPFARWQQSLSTDYLHEGATGAAGNVYEPFLAGCVRPDFLLPAYYSGRNLAESYYMALPSLSWQGIVLGDPLCSLGKP